MKKNTLSTMLLVMALTFAACGTKSGESTPNEKADQPTQTEKTEKAEETEATVDEEGEKSAISHIKEVWKTKTIDLGEREELPDVKQFALAFSEAYPDYKPNAAMKAYLAQPKNYDETKTGFHINTEQTRNGFISSRGMGQFDWDTDCCYWKRKDGHRLVAFWLSEGHENSGESQVLFYDYNPETYTMTPEPQLTDLVEKNAASFADFSVRLPAEGKDIEVMTFTENDMDSYDTTSFQMIWDGQTFSIKK